jgi:hypothetical protein
VAGALVGVGRAVEGLGVGGRGGFVPLGFVVGFRVGGLVAGGFVGGLKVGTGVGGKLKLPPCWM